MFELWMGNRGKRVCVCARFVGTIYISSITINCTFLFFFPFVFYLYSYLYKVFVLSFFLRVYTVIFHTVASAVRKSC